MKYLINLILLLITFGIFVFPVNAVNSFVTIVNPVRGLDAWEEKFQPEVTLRGQIDVLTKHNLPATWLLRPDVLESQKLTDLVMQAPPIDEKGLFLEITPGWAKSSGVKYHESKSWHFAGSVFLTGYSQDDRIKLIDTAFENFKKVFGIYPTSVGAWWIDSFSLNYMQEKYHITAALIVADQYSTDNYQIWGQYWSTPYFPSKKNALYPAQSVDQKIPVVMMQWASRDPVNGYGKGVEESTLSVQVNDYIDYHKLDIQYFSKLVDIYTKQELNQVNQLVVGLENSYSWEKYRDEYQKQIELLLRRKLSGEIGVVNMQQFSSWYRSNIKTISPTHIIVSDDPLGTNKTSIWFMNPYYRANLYFSDSGAIFRDIRQYVEGGSEICYNTICDSINFATNATRVLDEVTNGDRLVVTEGKISDIKVSHKDDKYDITYIDQSGKKHSVSFLPRDIEINDRISSIDSIILNALASSGNKSIKKVDSTQNISNQYNFVFEIVKFMLFIIFVIFIPGTWLFRNPFLALVGGMVVFTLIGFITSLLHFRELIWIYVLLGLAFFIIKKTYQQYKLSWDKASLIVSVLILAGVIFQVLPVFRSGSQTPYGLGFWGPNAHDGVWHLALVNELIKNVPPNSPILAGQMLKNYHYFYDLLIALTAEFSGISTASLIFRLYPILFSLLLGVGGYILSMKLYNSFKAGLLGIYLVYFAGSFGWIVEYIHQGHIGGESAFWANQPVSFNLNPPFAISLVILTAFLYLLSEFLDKSSKRYVFGLIILGASLISFKLYAFILLILTLFVFGLARLIFFKKSDVIFIFVGVLATGILVLIPNYSLSSLFLTGTSVFVFAPFWFIHSMIDSPDRVGWTRLTLTRMVGLESGNWVKFIGAEVLGLIIFIGGNLGVRIIGLLQLVNFKITRPKPGVFISIFTLISFVLPLIFIQSGNPWNTIQFFYYGMFFFALWAGVSLEFLFNKLGFIGKPLVVMLLFIAPINALVTANSYLYPIPNVVLSFDEQQALEFLSTQEAGNVLTHPYDTNLKKRYQGSLPVSVYETSSYVSAFSNQQTFLEDTIQQDILQTDYKQRLSDANLFFKTAGKDWSDKFIKEGNIKYIYLPDLFEVKLDAEDLDLKEIYKNNSVKIYQTNI